MLKKNSYNNNNNNNFKVIRNNVFSSVRADPVGFPRIETKDGRRAEGPIGPYEVGQEIELLCTTQGGEFFIFLFFIYLF